MAKSRHEKAKVVPEEQNGVMTGAATPALMGTSMAPHPASDGLGFAGPQAISSPVDADELADMIKRSFPENQASDVTAGEGNLRPIQDAKVIDGLTDEEPPALRVHQATVDVIPDSAPLPEPASGTLTPSASDPEQDPDSDSPSGTDTRERIINIRTCPLCHRPRLKRRSEQDIVTHLAICASADWNRVDRIVTANYVTSSQAQRKFFTRMVNKVAIGAYSLGANSANILVQDRRTGQLQEEKMAVYVRIGIRVLYKGARSQMEGARGECWSAISRICCA